MREGAWRIYLFGSLQAQSEQTTLNHLSMRRGGALLACLTLRAPHPVPREELLALLWPEESADVARNRLRVLLNSLRQQLETGDSPPGSVLTAERQTIALVPTAFTSDYHDFLRALQAARTATQDTDRIASLENAVRMYRGELLVGYYDDWILAERRHLATMRYQALRELAQRLMQVGASDRALDYARQAVSEEPLDEEAHCDLIRFYKEIGQPSAGLRQYEQLKRLLWEEMQAQPSETASRLAAQLTAAMGHGMVESRRSIRPITLRAEEQATEGQAYPDYLPPRLTRFFGREEEIAHLHALLAPNGTARLASLLGLGGTGKTRLALEAAARLQNDYAGRVYFVALADITDLNHIGSVFAKALRLPPTPGLDPLSQTLAVLNQAPTLLVLDNLEQLLPDAGPLIEHLLLEAPRLRCLLTSRRSAGVEGEQEIALEPLPVPDSEAIGGAWEENNQPEMSSLLACPGVALFVDRARAVRADFALTATNADDVAQLCRALEGLPLAIELAAARTRVMTPGEMRKQTGKLLNWLVDVRGGKNARHKSVRATLEWSYRLLALEDRRFFSALAVFVGGFDALAAGYVGIGESADLRETTGLLERLRAASLLTIVDTDAATSRFGMLATLREFGLERLAEMGTEAETRGRHLVYFGGVLWDQSRGFSENAREMTEVAAEDGNLREALEFGLRVDAARNEARVAINLAGRLTGYWERQGRWSEGRDYLRRASLFAELPSESTEGHGAKISVLRGAGVLANLLGEYGEARSFSREGLMLAQEDGDLAGIADCLSNLGNVAFYQHDYSDAQAQFEHALHLYRQTEDPKNIAACLVCLGNVTFFQGDHKAAQKRLEEALDIYRQTQDRHGIAAASLRLGNVWRDQSYFAEAHRHLDEALKIFQDIGHRHGVASCLHDQGVAAYFQSEYAEAQARYHEALNTFQAIGYRRGVGTCLGNLGSVAQDQGDYATAISYYGEAIKIYRELGDRRSLASCLCDLGRAALDQDNHAEALSRYTEALQIEQEIDSRAGIANCQGGLGRLALEQNDFAEARLRISHALETYHAMGARGGIAEMLEAHAHLAQKQARPEFAARLAGAASTLRKEIGFLRSTAPPTWQKALDAIRLALGEAAFAMAWEQGEALTSAQAVAEALQQASLEAEAISSDTPA